MNDFEKSEAALVALIVDDVACGFLDINRINQDIRAGVLTYAHIDDHEAAATAVSELVRERLNAIPKK